MNFFGIKIPSELITSVIIVLVAFITNLIVKVVIKKLLSLSIIKSKQQEKRKKTILILLQKIAKYIIVFLALMSILGVYKVDTTAIITSVGAVSIVIGFAFQDLLKDFLVGISIVLENSFSVGDIIEVCGYKGEVINFSLKTTTIKSVSGEVYIIANREITKITNYSMNKYLLKINVCTRYEEDVEKVTKVLSKLCERLPEKIEEVDSVVLEEGIEELGDSAVIYRLSTKINVKDRYVIKRKILKEIKKEFDKNNISIPYPQLEVHNE